MSFERSGCHFALAATRDCFIREVKAFDACLTKAGGFFSARLP
jgi:hypothetical protein